ncbi:hypothetical protein DPMN_132563 [Dreissena polymorpha]|uniref:Uncharacterized protein n=1 Tax=Dreissena polymorpha TaxID=45954 RepID=A0A9D4FRU7_DREPO|nr:hypothetical protein DPMN_132563 [Dreissena polymorpha]
MRPNAKRVQGFGSEISTKVPYFNKRSTNVNLRGPMNKEVSQDGGTQYAQRAGKTVLGLGSTADDD